MNAKLSRFICVGIVVLTGAAQRSEAGGPGWHGGGGWRGGGWRGGGFGGGVVIVTPGYYPPYPYYYGPYYSYPPGPAYYGDEAGGVSVATVVQTELSRRGYYRGPIDGIVGAGTRAAIAAYQRRHGLDVTGVIDTPLLRSLRL